MHHDAAFALLHAATTLLHAATMHHDAAFALLYAATTLLHAAATLRGAAISYLNKGYGDYGDCYANR